MITKDDYDIYVLGSPYWAGVNDRILVSGVNDAEFWADFLEGKGGKGFKKHLDCAENRATLLSKYQQLYPTEPLIRTKLNDLLWKLMISGNPDFINPHEEPVDDRPRDAQGRLMLGQEGERLHCGHGCVAFAPREDDRLYFFR